MDIARKILVFLFVALIVKPVCVFADVQQLFVGGIQTQPLSEFKDVITNCDCACAKCNCISEPSK